MNYTLQKLIRFYIPVAENNYKPAFLHTNMLFYIIVAMLVIKMLTVALYLPLSQNFFFADITKIDLLNLLNQNRKSVGLAPLTENNDLNKAARLKAEDMIKNGYFAHQSPSGITPWAWFKAAGYSYKYAGENLAVGFLDSQAVYNAWINSPSHKKNLLNKNYTEVGTAIISGFEGNSIVVVQEFGSPLAKTTTPPNLAPIKTITTTPKSTAPEPVKVTPAPAPAPKIKPEVKPEIKPEPTPTIQAINPIEPSVLGISSEYNIPSQTPRGNNIYLRFLNFIVYDINIIFQYLYYGLFIILAGYLAVNILLIPKMQNKVMVSQLVIFIAILSISMLLDKDIFSNTLPYQINI